MEPKFLVAWSWISFWLRDVPAASSRFQARESTARPGTGGTPGPSPCWCPSSSRTGCGLSRLEGMRATNLSLQNVLRDLLSLNLRSDPRALGVATDAGSPRQSCACLQRDGCCLCFPSGRGQRINCVD